MTSIRTSFSDIFDKFFLLINDYRLITLYQTDETRFNNRLSGWLIYAVNDFDVCDQSLSYSETTMTFSESLSTKNQLLLARMMVKYWLEQEVKDINQMSLHITDADFKHYSEAQNLTAKRELLNNVKEEISQALVDYGLKANDWASWFEGTFYVP